MVTVSDKIILIVLIKTSNSHRNINKPKSNAMYASFKFVNKPLTISDKMLRRFS